MGKGAVPDVRGDLESLGKGIEANAKDIGIQVVLLYVLEQTPGHASECPDEVCPALGKGPRGLVSPVRRVPDLLVGDNIWCSHKCPLTGSLCPGSFAV